MGKEKLISFEKKRLMLYKKKKDDTKELLEAIQKLPKEEKCKVFDFCMLL